MLVKKAILHGLNELPYCPPGKLVYQSSKADWQLIKEQTVTFAFALTRTVKENYIVFIEYMGLNLKTLLLSLKLRAGDCLLFGVFYRSPSSSESNNLALNTILSMLCVQESPKYSHLYVVGDFFNAHAPRWRLNFFVNKNK